MISLPSLLLQFNLESICVLYKCQSQLNSIPIQSSYTFNQKLFIIIDYYLHFIMNYIKTIIVPIHSLHIYFD